MHRSADIAIVGAGIIGLAHAYHALRRGLKVVLFEREQFAIGASVRNFGMIWPIGQPAGEDLEMALNSRKHWLDVADQAGFWINRNGSLHLAYNEDEWAVLNEFVDLYNKQGYDIQLLDKTSVELKSSVINPHKLIGGLWSETECTVNSRVVLKKIPAWLEQEYGLVLRFGQQVQAITLPLVETSTEKWKVGKVIVCSGADFQTLYPSAFKAKKIMKCKLQMMKAEVPGNALDLGPSLCAGLTLRHYKAFKNCPSLSLMDARYDSENPFFKQYGIHVLLSQNNEGELIIGDSHEYGDTLEPFDKTEIDAEIINYLSSFISIPKIEIVERWHGIYAKLPDENYWVTEVDKGVHIVNGLGGAGMTLSFGLAEKVISQL